MDFKSSSLNYATAQCLNMKSLKRALLNYFDGLSNSKHRDLKSRNNNNIVDTKSLSVMQKKRRWRSIKKVIPAPLIAPTKQKWVQLAGHQDSFAVGEEGTILKKLSTNEKEMLEQLMSDPLRPFVPTYKGVVSVESKQYIEMEDLLRGFSDPCVMDCKMGVRTYLETELTKLEQKPELRPDMYEKMVKIDPNEPTAEEHAAKAVTKPRYMMFRETLSSTANLGFRIEGVKNSDGKAFVQFANCKERSDVQKAIGEFANLSPDILKQYIERLKTLRSTSMKSKLFQTHELIGSSLLFVHDKTKASVWMIDFGKTMKLPASTTINHESAWKRGNHEDGYLTGVNNIISILENLLARV